MHGEQQGEVRRPRSGILAVSKERRAKPVAAGGALSRRPAGFQGGTSSQSSRILTPNLAPLPGSHSAVSNYSPFPEHSVPWQIRRLGSKVLVISSSTPLFGLSFKAPLGDLFCQVLLTPHPTPTSLSAHTGCTAPCAGSSRFSDIPSSPVSSSKCLSLGT